MKNKQRKIMITGCSTEKFWYKNFVGKKFDVLEETEKGYKVENKKITGRVLKKDCVVI